MFENYVCKIYVSNDPHFSSHLEATAFGFDNGQQQKILTAAHVVTNALGKIYPVSNTLKLYVKFLNHQGLVNEEPVLVDFILNEANDRADFKDGIPFVDSAEIVLPAGIQQPVSSYFKVLARFVKAFVMGNKNGVMDARAIWMAVQQPGKEIAVKTEEQQSILVLHRSRRQLVKFRTAQINALHGTLLEFGETIHKGRAAMEREFPEALERMKERLPLYLITVLENQYYRLNELDSLIDDIEKQLTSVARQNETCRRLLDIPGVGPLIATAALAIMGKASVFKSGREFAAYVGLVPRQTGSGGKIRLLGISKRGDKYLRTLFIHGARAAALLTKEPGPWITELKKRRPASVAIVAMANKLARTVWAIAAHGRKYDKNHVSIRPY